MAILLILSAQAIAQASKAPPESARPYYDELRALGNLSPLVTQVCFLDGSPDRFDVLGFSRQFVEMSKGKSIKLDAAQESYSGRDFLLLEMYDKGIKTGESMLQHDPNESDRWVEHLNSKGISYRLRVTIDSAGRYRRMVAVNHRVGVGEDRTGKCEPIR